MFFLSQCCHGSFPYWGHSPPHLPRMPCNIVLAPGPVVGAAQIPIRSYSCVFLPPTSTAIRTSVLRFARALFVLLYSP